MTKSYNEALERAKECLKDGTITNTAKSYIETIFPELKESNDEKVRKALIRVLNENVGNGIEKYGAKLEDALAWLEKQDRSKNIEGSKVMLNACINTLRTVGHSHLADWLEKQGNIPKEVTCTREVEVGNGNIKALVTEKIPIYKVESKFHVGDWITNSIETVQITGYDIDYGYQVDYKGYLQHRDTDIIEKEYHLWTIQDAKDGDVLSWDDSKCIALFKNIYDEESFNSHGFVGHCTGVFESRLSYHDIEGAHPATKEQRDLLFAKMEKAGYEWEEGNKELKLLITNGGDF